MSAEQTRYQTLYYAGVIGNLYGQSVSDLRTALPNLRFTSSPTPDQNTLINGQYLPTIYQPLDFRYLESWNEGIYLCAGFDMIESFWTNLLRMEQPAQQPLWITTPMSFQTGSTFRRSLEAISHGANAIGYNAEGAAGMRGGWGAVPTTSSQSTAQEALTGRLARDYGTWFAQFTPNERIGIYYSANQVGNTNQAFISPLYFAYYTFAQSNRPAKFLTEDDIANNNALDSVDALVLASQTSSIPAATLAKINAFIAAGKKVICDTNTTVAITGMSNLANVSLTCTLDAFAGNKNHDILQGMVAANGPALKSALGTIGQQPLLCDDGSTLVASTLHAASGAQLVFVTNNQYYPFNAMFTTTEQMCSWWRYFYNRGDVFTKDYVVPRTVTLTLRDDLAANPPHIYDVFAGTELPVTTQGSTKTVTVDLTLLTGRVLLLSGTTITAPSLSLGNRDTTDPTVTVIAQSALPLPIRIRMGTQEVYRTSTPAGSCDTFAIGPATGNTSIEVTELVTGQDQTGSVSLTAPAAAATNEEAMTDIRDTSRILSVLQAGNVALYIDPRQTDLLPLAQHYAAQLCTTMPVLCNPPVSDYQIDWDPTNLDAHQADETILAEGDVALRRLVNGTPTWTGSLSPATVAARPLILFGNASNNRLIADIDTVALLCRPAENIGPGFAVVQPLAAPFWDENDVVVVLCDDEAGMKAGFDALVQISQQQTVPTVSEDIEARSDLRKLLGFDALSYPAASPLSTSTTTTTIGIPLNAPIRALRESGGNVYALLRNIGSNYVKLNGSGQTVWQTTTAPCELPNELFVTAAGDSLTSDTNTFLWRHDASGQLIWKSMGTVQSNLLADGSVWLTAADGSLNLLSSTGAVLQTATLAATDTLLGITPDGTIAFTYRPGTDAGYTKSEAQFVAVTLATGQDKWVIDSCCIADPESGSDPLHTRMAISADGSTVALLEQENLGGRDDIDLPDSSRIRVIRISDGTVLVNQPLGQKFGDIRITADGALVVAGAIGYSNLLYIVNVTTGYVYYVTLPEYGAWTRELSADGSECWVACDDDVYRVTLSTLAVTNVLNERVLTLAARTGGGMYAGTADGRLLWVEENGTVDYSVNLAQGIAVSDIAATLTTFQTVPTAEWPQSMYPHAVPSTFSLVPESPYPAASGDKVTTYGSPAIPLQACVQIPYTGQYRVTVELGTDASRGNYIGNLAYALDASTNWTYSTVYNGDSWQQTAVLMCTAGAHVINVQFGTGWTDTNDEWVTTMTVESVNDYPIVTLTAPTSGINYLPPATINLAATASDPDGTIARVEFYNGATLVGTATTSPYSYNWSNVGRGSYTLTATAYDNLGAITQLHSRLDYRHRAANGEHHHTHGQCVTLHHDGHHRGDRRGERRNDYQGGVL